MLPAVIKGEKGVEDKAENSEFVYREKGVEKRLRLRTTLAICYMMMIF